jgi:Leucine Rich Repeat (LRR) protein
MKCLNLARATYSVCLRSFASAGLALTIANAAQGAIPQSERDVLLEIYAATNGDEWTTQDGWNDEPGTECSWYGVTCTGDHVTEIALSGNHLTGNLPDISGLTELTGFFVALNYLHGSIPALSHLSHLEFFGVGSNLLTGSIPSLTGLTNLVDLDVPFNLLSGTVPSLAGLTSLRYFNISNNQLSGEMPDVPDPDALQAGQSNLCPNALNHTPNSAWDAATSTSPWYINCNVSVDIVFFDGFDE